LRINYNSKIIKQSNFALELENRAFRYGDGLFESIRMFDGKLPFWKYHWKRLSKGIQYLKFEKTEFPDFYFKEINKLCGDKGNWRIRLSLFRKDGGFYAPKTSKTNFLIEALPLDSNEFTLNKKGLNIDICDAVTLPIHPVFQLKTNNSLPYVIASIFIKKSLLDDCILLNQKGQIAEASSSNIFILKNKILHAPKLNSGCKDGTMRKVIFKLAPDLNLEIKKKNFLPADLKGADEIWLSNATQGIRWVGNFQGTKFQNEVASKMIKSLNKKYLK